jgi:autotransporter-associated beta strand protein
VVLAVALGTASLTSAFATSRTWNGGGTDNFWTTPANWGGTAPATNGVDGLLFYGSTLQNNTNNFTAISVVNATTPARAIYFDTGGWTLNGNPVALGGAMESFTGINAINHNIILTGNRSVYVTAGELALNGVVSSTAAYGISKLGQGTLVLSGTNTYSGTTTVANNTGTLKITNPCALGTGSVTLSRAGTGTGYLQIATVGENTITNTFTGFSSGNAGEGAVPTIENLSGTNTLTSNLRVTKTGGNGLIVYSSGGLLKLNGVVDTTVNSRFLNIQGAANGEINGPIANGTSTGYNIAKAGAGKWTLNGTNTTTGATYVQNGTLALGATGSISNSAAVRIYPGATFDVSAQAGGWPLQAAQALEGNGVVQGSVVAEANSVLRPNVGATLNTAGTLTINGDLVLNGTTNFFNLSSDPSGVVSPSDVIQVNGNLSVAGLNTFWLENYLDGYIPNGTYQLIKFTGSLTGDASNFAVTNFTIGARGVQGGYIVANTGSIDLVVTGTPPALLTWTGDGAGNNWDINTSSNWLNGVLQDVFYDYDAVIFDDSATNRTVNFSVAVQPGGVVVNSTNDYDFENLGGKITGLTGVTKLGSGTLTNNVNHDYTGVTLYGGGKLSVLSIGNGGVAGPLGAAASTPDRQVLDGGILEYTGPGESNDRRFTVGSNGGGISVADPNATLIFNGNSAMQANGNTFTKYGPGTLQYSQLGFLTGTNYILGGVLRIPTVSLFGAERTIPVFIDGGALNINGQTMEDKPVVVKGMGDLTLGVTNGAIINLGADQTQGLRFVTLSGDTAFGGTGRWDIRANPTATLSTDGNPYNLIKVGANLISLAGVTVDSALGDIEVREGALLYATSTTGLGNPAKTLTVRAGAQLQTFAPTTALNKQIVLNDYATLTNISGLATLSGPVNMTGDSFAGPTIGVASGTTLNLSGGVGGPGNLTKEGAGTLNLSGTNTYTGTTTVNAGKLVMSTAKTSGGSITVLDGTTLGVSVSGTNQLNVDSLVLGYGTDPVTVEFTGLNSTTTVPVYGTGAYAYSPLTIKVLSGTFSVGQVYPLISGSSVYFASAVLSETPPFVEATLTNIGGNTLAMVVTAVSATYQTWSGAANGNWDIGTTTNWLSGVTPAVYADGNAALFDDTASNSTVSVATPVSPSAIYLNNNSKNYSFAGSAITGSGSLNKQGTGSLTLSSANSYSGGTTLGAGTLIVNHDQALGTGLLTINLGTIDSQGSSPITLTNAQVWNGAFGFGGSQALALNGTVSLGANVQVSPGGVSSLTVGGAISDGGAGYGLTKAGAGSMVLSGANSYQGATVVSAGSLTLAGNQAAANGGLSVGPASTGGSLNIAPGAIVTVATNKTVRIGNTGSTGTTTINMYVGGTVTNAGTLLAARTSNLQITNGGSWLQSDNMEVRANGGYSSRVRVLANATFTYTGTNTIKLNGSSYGGRAQLLLSGTFNTPVGFEQTMTGGSDIILNTGGTLRLTASVPSLLTNGVLLSALGGTIDTAGFDTDVTGDVTGDGGWTKAGAGTLVLESVNNTNAGSLFITGGSLALSNSAVLVSTNISLAGGAAFDVAGLLSPFALAGGQTLGNSSSTALIKGNVDATLGSLALTYAAGTPALSVANGALTLDAATPVTVNNTGAALGNGSYKLIAAGSAGSVAGTVPATVTVTGNGLGSSGSAALSLTGNELFLDVTGVVTVNTTPTNIVSSVSSGNLNLSWPTDHTGWRLEVQTNGLGVGLATNWFTWPDSASTNAVSIPINPANPAVFYRLVYP